MSVGVRVRVYATTRVCLMTNKTHKCDVYQPRTNAYLTNEPVDSFDLVDAERQSQTIDGNIHRIIITHTYTHTRTHTHTHARALYTLTPHPTTSDLVISQLCFDVVFVMPDLRHAIPAPYVCASMRVHVCMNSYVGDSECG